jgi:hypothetical protein
MMSRPIREDLTFLAQSLAHLDYTKQRQAQFSSEVPAVTETDIVHRGIGDLDFDWKYFLGTDSEAKTGVTSPDGWACTKPKK